MREEQGKSDLLFYFNIILTPNTSMFNIQSTNARVHKGARASQHVSFAPMFQIYLRETGTVHNLVYRMPNRKKYNKVC